MRQFDVFANPAATQAVTVPYVAILSSHLVDLSGVLVAPLHADSRAAAQAVEISVVIEGRPVLLTLLDMAAVSPSQLRLKVGSLIEYEDAIRRGLDRIFTGF